MAPLFYCILGLLWIRFHVILSSKQNCVPVAKRQGVDIYEWKHIEYGVCNLLLNKPLIIKNSGITQWSKSQQKEILNTMKDFEISVVYQYSFCDCFKNQNDTHLCHEYVKSFQYYSTAMMSLLNMNHRNDSIWYKYQPNYDINMKYLKCIHRKTKMLSIERTLKRLKRMEKRQNNVLMNKKSNESLKAIQFPFGMSLEAEQIIHYDSIIKYSNVSPYFKPFHSVLSSLNDIKMLNIWMGSTKYKTTVHFDKTDIIYFLLNGNKTFLLSSPDLYNKFTLYPFLDINLRNAVYNNLNEHNFEYKLNLYKNDVFFLPAYWHHQVINGKYNTFAINLWTVNKLSHKIKTHQFSRNMKTYLSNVNKNSWKYIIFYFIHKLLDGYNMSPLLMKYFSRLYPILKDIQKYHLMLCNIEYNTEWLFWFIQYENILKCYGDSATHSELFNDMLNNRYNSMICPSIHNNDIDSNELNIINECNDEIDEILNKIRNINIMRGDEVAQIELAEFIEKILFMITDDVMFHPFLIALYFL